MKELIYAKGSDVYDVLAFVADAIETRTRLGRVKKTKPSIADEFGSYKQRKFIDFVLEKHIEDVCGNWWETKCEH